MADGPRIALIIRASDPADRINGQPLHVAAQVFAVHRCAANAAILDEFSATLKLRLLAESTSQLTVCP